MRVFLLIAVAIMGAGCASNGYRQFYTAMPDAPNTLSRRASAPTATPSIDSVDGTFDDVASHYRRQGYAVIGYSSFNSGRNDSEKGAITQAIQVQADRVVIIRPRYTGTVTTNVPITTPTSQTSYTDGTATAYGNGGSATAYGNSTTTTYGSQTTYIPITTNRSDYAAVYLVKVGFVFGAYFDELSDSDRSTLQTNKGVRITTIVDASPAYAADVLVGDILLAANGQSIYGVKAFADLVQSNRGQEVELQVSRNGQILTKRVRLNNP